MSRRHRRPLALVLALLIGLAACGDDTGGEAGDATSDQSSSDESSSDESSGEGSSGDATSDQSSGEGFSIEGLLGELPLMDEPSLVVSISDLEAATSLGGLDRPDGADDDTVIEWFLALGGFRTDAQHPVFVPLPDTLQLMGPVSEFAAELGWNPVEVSQAAEAHAAPHRFFVAVGEGLGPAAFDDAEVADLGDGVVTAGEGADLAVDVAGRTAARPLGRPLRMAATDGRLVATHSTTMARDWLTGDRATLADSAPHRAIAAALDGTGAYSAMLVSFPVEPGPIEDAPDDGSTLTARFGHVGVGWSMSDGEPVIHVVHHWASSATAGSQVEVIELRLREGRSRDDVPLADRFVLDEVVAHGELTVTTMRFAGEGHVRTPVDMIFNGEPLFASG